MAERRMFAKTIVLSDAFLDMPLSARCLYFTLGMLADDDGFVNSPKGVMRQCSATEDDLRMLLAKKFVLSFETGVIVIKHWRINNYLRSDRYKETSCLEEKQTLTIKQNGAYSLGIPNQEAIGIPSGIPTVYPGKDSIGKDSIGKDSIGNIEADASETSQKTTKRKYGSYKNVLLSDEELETLKEEYDDWFERIERLSEYIASSGKKYKNFLATIRSWARKENKGNRKGQQSLADIASEISDSLERGIF